MSLLVVTPFFQSKGQGKFSTEKMVLARAVLPSSYPHTAGIVLAASDFGFTAFSTDTVGNTVDPIVLNVTGTGDLKSLVGSIVAKVLRIFHTTGGTTTGAAANSAPVTTTTPDAGATGLTGSAAKPALVGVCSAGIGKEIADTLDVSGVTVTIMAFGH
jgi:hypothetical protein